MAGSKYLDSDHALTDQRPCESCPRVPHYFAKSAAESFTFLPDTAANMLSHVGSKWLNATPKNGNSLTSPVFTSFCGGPFNFDVDFNRRGPMRVSIVEGDRNYSALPWERDIKMICVCVRTADWLPRQSTVSWRVALVSSSFVRKARKGWKHGGNPIRVRNKRCLANAYMHIYIWCRSGGVDSRYGNCVSNDGWSALQRLYRDPPVPSKLALLPVTHSCE